MSLTPTSNPLRLATGAVALDAPRRADAHTGAAHGGALPLRRHVLTGFGLALLVLLVVAAAAWYATGRFMQRADDALRSAEIVAPLERGVSQLYEAGAAQRGYLFTGSADFLAQRARAIAGWQGALAELRTASAADPVLSARIDALQALGEAREQRLDEVLTAHARSPDEARQMLAANHGAAEMQTLADQANALADAQRRLLRENADAARQASTRMVWALGLAVAAVAVLLALQMRALLGGLAERQRAHAALFESETRLRAANEELGNFAYVASHDLKAPLRAIGSLAQWVVDDYGERLDDEGRAQMALLLGRVKRMDRLIDGILQYSRVGRVKESSSPVDLNVLVREAVDLLAPPPHVAVEIGMLPTLRIEPTRAQQVFQNLLANAIQYMDKPEGRIAVRCDDEGAAWHFRVADNGPGIEPRHWERVFQMFQSLKTRDAGESTGIGLSLVKKIVEMYGGRIWIESEPGHGCTFHFTLPKNAPCT